MSQVSDYTYKNREWFDNSKKTRISVNKSSKEEKVEASYVLSWNAFSC